MKTILIPVIILTFLFSNSSCSNQGENSTGEKNEASKSSEDEHKDEEDPNTASLTDEQISSIGIELGSIEEKQLTSSIKTNGVLKVPNQNKASVNSLYSGVIRSLLVQPGNTVSKGQTIATIANPEFIQTQSAYLDVNDKIALAELEVKRQKDLNAGNAGALKNLQAAETELRTLRTARSTYAQQIQLMGINPSSLQKGNLVSVLAVRSPISGVVSNVIIKMGGYVDLTTTVAEIVDNSQLHLDLFVYEKDLPKLKNNQVIHFTVTNNPGEEYDAQIYSLGSSFEGESKAITVHAKVQGDKTGLIDGMNVTAVVSLEKKTVPAVPSDAIVTVDGQDYIFVLKEDHKDDVHTEIQKELAPSTTEKPTDKKNAENHTETSTRTFERIAVAKGNTDVGFTEITPLSPIANNARIVIKGAFFVSAKMTNTEGHAH